VTEEAWSSFTDKESESWGVLNFEMTPEITPTGYDLYDYSELFVRGMSPVLHCVPAPRVLLVTNA